MSPSVTTSGTGSASAAPDAIRLRVGVRHRDASVARALAGAAEALQRLGEVARRFTGEDKISSQGLAVWQHHDRADRPSGFEAAHTVEIVLDEFDAAGDLLTALGDRVGDALRLEGIQPFLGDPQPLLATARERAFAEARRRADALAALAGHVVEHAEHVAEGAGVPHRAGGEVALAAAGPGLEPGSTSVSVTVTVEWRTRLAG